MTQGAINFDISHATFLLKVDCTFLVQYLNSFFITNPFIRNKYQVSKKMALSLMEHNMNINRQSSKLGLFSIPNEPT